jgi:hypothetical protein
MAGKKTFVAGEVLTAQDVNDYLMDQSVMTFASSAARSSAIPTPTTGMTTYVSDRNQIETFDGAEYRGMSGLQLVKKQTIGTGVSSVVVTGAYSATYDAYKIIISGGVASTNVDLAIINTGSTASYQYSFSFLNYTTTAVSNGSSNSAASIPLIGHGSTGTLRANVEVNNPFLAKPTIFSASIAGTFSAGNINGLHNVSTSYTGFTITPSSGTLTGGTIYVYGYGT